MFVTMFLRLYEANVRYLLILKREKNLATKFSWRIIFSSFFCIKNK